MLSPLSKKEKRSTSDKAEKSKEKDKKKKDKENSSKSSFLQPKKSPKALRKLSQKSLNKAESECNVQQYGIFLDIHSPLSFIFS